MVCCRPRCMRPRYGPWYLCENCLRAWIVYISTIEPEPFLRRAIPIMPKIKGGGGLGPVLKESETVYRTVAAGGNRVWI